ncbi:PLANT INTRACELLULAR RAS-GROUP-RELATED LRR PROTEIN 5 [Salix purpurea]|uniref:PLANT INTRACELLULAR RAS-GROUP-RELATED LRR PROTEIN 5 n=1 Tax=Salix purpurea TaxID=77065 RepID=A0A9Q0YVU0_SALPP|nr:PLANT INTRACELLULAR RAS-GROUP-RELATED LRR PROTEIN 5 [Salix purpurea]
MTVKTRKNQVPSPAFLETVEEITRLYKSLPSRPSIEEVEAAISVIKTVSNEEQARLDDFGELECPQDVPQELFSVLQQARKTVVLFQSHEQRKEALYLVEADKMLEKIRWVDTKNFFGGFWGYPEGETDFYQFGARLKLVENGEVNSEKLSLMKVAAVIEKSAKTGAVVLDLRGKLMDRVEWLPLSIGKLSAITKLDLSENRIMALPTTISSLQALTKLDVHSNQLINLPGSFGELINLTHLDLRENRLRSLPASFVKLTKLEDLDLSLNQFTQLPETVGRVTRLKILNVMALPTTISSLKALTKLDVHSNQLINLPESLGELINLTHLDLRANRLKILNVETNELEEIPYTIGSCTSLVELRLDFNQLKSLPEAIGKLDCLEILALHYNRIRGLPTTMGQLSNLRELDVSFNELESIPENLCFAENLKKLNVANNFADLRYLPRNIGNLELLEELDISDDQIRVLPDSFRLLSKLSVFRADETPLEIPPRQVTILGAQAVVQFMADLVNKGDADTPLSKKKKVCSILWPFQEQLNHLVDKMLEVICLASMCIVIDE